MEGRWPFVGRPARPSTQTRAQCATAPALTRAVVGRASEALALWPVSGQPRSHHAHRHGEIAWFADRADDTPRVYAASLTTPAVRPRHATRNARCRATPSRRPRHRAGVETVLRDPRRTPAQARLLADASVTPRTPTCDSCTSATTSVCSTNGGPGDPEKAADGSAHRTEEMVMEPRPNVAVSIVAGSSASPPQRCRCPAGSGRLPVDTGEVVDVVSWRVVAVCGDPGAASRPGVLPSTAVPAEGSGKRASFTHL